MPSETSFFGQLFRWFRIGRAKTNQVTTAAEQQHLEALLQEQAIRNKERLMAAKDSVDGAFGQVEILKTQIAGNETEYNRMVARYKALSAAGQTEGAGKVALQIKTLKAEMDLNRQQLDLAQKNADTAIRILKQAQEEQKRAEEEAKANIRQHKLSSALAASIEQNSNLASGFDSEAARSQRLNEMAREMAANAKGRLQVSSQLVDSSNMILKEEEEKALAAQAAAELDAELGLTPTPKKKESDAAQSPVKQGM
jgi:hypothetical protein